MTTTLFAWDTPQRWIVGGSPADVVLKPYEPPPPPEKLDFTQSSYMRKVHDPQALLDVAKSLLRYKRYDTLVGTGLSGAIAVPFLARALKKDYLVVRKPNDGTHSSLPVEGKLGKKWIFVDDLVGGGGTFARCWDTVTKLAKDRSFETTFAGTMLYSDYVFYPPKDFHHGWLSRYSERYDGKQYDLNGMSWY